MEETQKQTCKIRYWY